MGHDPGSLSSADSWTSEHKHDATNLGRDVPLHESAALLREISRYVFVSGGGEVSLFEIASKFGVHFSVSVRTDSGRNDGQFKQWLEDSGQFVLTRQSQKEWIVSLAPDEDLLQEICELLSSTDGVSLSELSRDFGVDFNRFVRKNGGRNDGQFKRWLE